VTVLRNNFDTGPNDATITIANSNDVPGNDGFDIVGGAGTGSITQYSTDFSRATAEFTAHLKSAAVASAPCVVWSTSMGSQSQIWFREYVLWTSYLPGTTARPVFECDNGTVYTSFVVIKGTTGVLAVLDTNQVECVSFTNGISLNKWYRLECRFQFSTTTGNCELRLYDEPDSDTPLETITASSRNFGAATANSFAFGYAISHTNQPDMYISGLELNNVGWPGPAPFRLGRGSPSGALTNPITVHSGFG
jgi:hypothetical protein